MEDGSQRSRSLGILNKGPDGRSEDSFDPYNLNVPEFNPDLYLHKLLRECNLTHLMQKEHEIFRQIQLLDSEMQTLVYENYNKFISATDTIRKMKNDFKQMEEEMDHLSTNMASITEFSKNISETLQGRRQKIAKLSGVHSLLKKLQFLFELPTRLNNYIENENYNMAVKQYIKSQKVLQQYQHMPSFHGIQEDCNKIVVELKKKLRSQFRAKDATPKELAQCVDLLLQLEEPTEVLCDEFLEHAKQKLNADLEDLTNQVQLCQASVTPENSDGKMDVLEFVDLSYNNFLSDMSLVVASYGDLFLHKVPERGEKESPSDIKVPLKRLKLFVETLMQEYFKHIELRVSLEKETTDNATLVRALDRFYRRVQAMNKLLPDVDFSKRGIQIVSDAGRQRCNYYLQYLKERFAECMINVRQALTASTTLSQDNSNKLGELLCLFEASIADNVKAVLADLECFIMPEVTFASNPQFNERFCQQFVREGVIVPFFQHINEIAMKLCSGSCDKNTAPLQIILLLSKVCMSLEQTSISYLLSFTDDHFKIQGIVGLTSASVICKETKESAQKLINHFVTLQGLNISQMLRKSVETRDWLNAIEPRTVRAVMKRVVEDITAIDSQVGQLYEEGPQKDRSSDSSRRTYPSMGRAHKSKYNVYAPSALDNSLMSNIQKLFSERIEIFSTIEFSKVSVMTGIIKISLKTFLECVRLRTFNKYGLQQTQVDTHYLQLYLWHFVSDENLVHALLDEIMSSSVNRCTDPVLMEPSVVEVICDRG